MKKILLSLLTTGIIATNVLAYEVGDRMPDFNSMDTIMEGKWFGGGKRGKWIEVDQDGDGYADYRVVYQYCNKKMQKKPFSFYEIISGMIYLDKNKDEIIEKKREYGGERISSDAPNCLNLIMV